MSGKINLINGHFITLDDHCPNAEMIHENGFYIPNNPDLTNEEINTICNLLESDSEKNLEI